MRKPAKFAIGIGLLLMLAAGLGLERKLRHGFGAKDEPMAVERALARRLRYMAVPRAHRLLENPVPLTPEVLERARAHFADHCALCHGNDGKGQTAIGQGLYPKAPDMRLPDTQGLPDGHLFYLIKNGVRLTGMPGWGKDTPEDDRETWELVHFIRHLPNISRQDLIEMDGLNPKTRSELKQEEEEDKFLEGGNAPVAGSTHDHPKP